MTDTRKPPSGPVVVCYDGSKHAADALAAASKLVRAERVVILTVWKPILETVLAVSLGPAPAISDLADADERQRRAASDYAREGARRAAQAGLKAEPLAVRADGSVWEAVEETADELDASLIVCGTGRVGVLSAVLDSVPAALVYRAARPVMVVPSAEASVERERERQEPRQRRSERRAVAR